MKYFRLFGLMTMLAAVAPAGAAQVPASRVVQLDRIVAVINEDVITRRDLDDTGPNLACG